MTTEVQPRLTVWEKVEILREQGVEEFGWVGPGVVEFFHGNESRDSGPRRSCRSAALTSGNSNETGTSANMKIVGRLPGQYSFST